MEQFPDKCIVSAVHKLHLLDMFDYVYIFDDGKIVDEGKPDELMSRRSLSGVVAGEVTFNGELLTEQGQPTVAPD